MREEEMKLKRGDRVRAVNVKDNDELRGKTGTVISIEDTYFNPYLVEFDEPINYGHNGDGKGKISHCWWCYEKEIEPLDEKPSDEWDSSFQAVFAEKKRMCKSYTNCKECPFAAVSPLGLCDIFFRKRPYKAEQIIKKWSLAHPKEPPKHIKTRAEDFLEKHPNAPTWEIEKIPIACARHCGYLEENGCPDVDCAKCWNEPLEESEEQR